MVSHVSSDIDLAVATLLRVAGMLMEDASADAVTVPPTDRDARAALTDRLRDAGYDIAVLTAAAHVLVARRNADDQHRGGALFDDASADDE